MKKRKEQDLFILKPDMVGQSYRRPKCCPSTQKLCLQARTNTYAKNEDALQRTLDIQWIVHNFVQVHFTTKQVPAVAIGVLDKGLCFPPLYNSPQKLDRVLNLFITQRVKKSSNQKRG
jgi:hypothetical protein